LSYSLDESKKLSSAEKKYVVVESAKRLSPLGVDILKAEFPLDLGETDQQVWAEACAEISAASVVPWILLSASVDYDVFLRQVIVACAQGASGIAVGRAVWKEAVLMTAEDRIKFLQTTARQRMSRLTSLCHALAKPYTDFYSADARFDWYKTYEGK
jgi:tagatose-1,6-bisphosphate aldolase